jgi:hypothetical protein
MTEPARVRSSLCKNSLLHKHVLEQVARILLGTYRVLLHIAFQVDPLQEIPETFCVCTIAANIEGAALRLESKPGRPLLLGVPVPLVKRKLYLRLAES